MTTSGPLSPRHGDVVITREPERENSCTISVVPGEPQVRCSTYEEALAFVTMWALRQPLAVWFTEDGRTFTALEAVGGQWPPASGGPKIPPRGQ